MGEEKVRTAFEFGPQINEVLERLSSEMGTTKVDTLRKALGLYDEVYREVNERHGEVVFQNDKSGPRKLIIP